MVISKLRYEMDIADRIYQHEREVRLGLPMEDAQRYGDFVAACDPGRSDPGTTAAGGCAETRLHGVTGGW